MVLFQTFNRRFELTFIAYTYYVRCLFTCMFRSPMEWTYEHDVRCALCNHLGHKKVVLKEDEYGI